MIAHVLQRAREAGLGPVAVACGEAEIAEAVREAGGVAVLTDPDLPSGSDRIFAALRALDPAERYDTVINLQGDLPSIDPAYLQAVLQPLQHRASTSRTLVAPITSAEEAAAPSVVKCVCAFAEGQSVAPALYFSRNPVPSGDGAALASYRHLRLSPRGAGAVRRPAALAAGTAREARAAAGAGGGHAHRRGAGGDGAVRGRYAGGP